MRALSLLVVIVALILLPTALGAEEQPPAPESALHADWLQSPSNQIAADPSVLKFSDIGSESGQPTCFKLRSYFVARVHPRTDETRVVGYSTCQWSSKYAVKRAIEQARPSAIPAGTRDH